jgi:putative flippase GtrA
LVSRQISDWWLALKALFLRLSKLADRYSVGLLAYFGVAAVSALSEWASFLASLSFVGPIAAAFVGFFFGTLVNFFLSRNFVFQSVRPAGQELILVVALSAVAFCVNFMAYVALFAWIGVNILLAKIIGTGCGFAFNYIARQFFIFSNTSPYGPISALSRNMVPSRSQKRSTRGYDQV